MRCLTVTASTPARKNGTEQSGLGEYERARAPLSAHYETREDALNHPDERDQRARERPVRSADSAFNMGLLRETQGDLAGALQAYRHAAERGHPAAASLLGVLLHGRGELIGAERAYRRADEHGDATSSFNLGVLLEQRGDLAGAESAYRRADKRGHGAAASNLGVILEEQGDLAGAAAAYRRSDERGDPKGAFNLGMMLEERGQLAAAREAYRRANEHREEEAGAGRAHRSAHPRTIRESNPAEQDRPADTAGTAETARSARSREPDAPPSTRPSAGPASASKGRAAPGAIKKRVLAAFADGSVKTVAEVAAETGVKPSTIRTTLSRAAKSRQVLKAEGGYRLSAPAEKLPDRS